MKKLLSFIILIGSCVAADASPCKLSSLSNYLPHGFACTDGPLTFSQFVYSGTLPAGNITVDPVGQALFFRGSWNIVSNKAGSKQVQDSEIVYTVTGDVDNISLDLENFGVTGYGAIVGFENIAFGGRFLGSLRVFDNKKRGIKSSASLQLPELSGPFRLEKDLVLSASSRNSSAWVGILSNEFNTPTPEPGSLALLGSGLVAIGGVLRRKLRVN